MTTRLRIALTAGEPAGIGPDIILLLLQQQQWAEVDLVVIADPVVLQARADALGISVRLREYSPTTLTSACPPGECWVLPIPTAAPVEAGVLNPANAPYVLATLRRAVEGCLSGEFASMVTAPLHKGVINDAGIPFTGHTEFLAELTHAPLPVMMLASHNLRVALATTHVPLAQVSSQITRESLPTLAPACVQSWQFPNRHRLTACAAGFALTSLARPLRLPYRVHFRFGPTFRFRLLPTPRCRGAVAFHCPRLAACPRVMTFTF